MESNGGGGGGTAECVCPNGCGCSGTDITISVTPTTGGQFELAVTKTDSIESLKKLISKRLKVPKERICLLHRERQLREGTVQENQLVNGSRLTLLPSVETGLLAQRPEQSVMQALESLNDSQVNDFLSGKAPLNLTMRLGDHMMLIQLQLSTVAPSGSRKGKGSAQQQQQGTAAQAAAVAAQAAAAAAAAAAQAASQQQAAAAAAAQQAAQAAQVAASTSRDEQTQATPTTPDCKCEAKPVLDTKALAEASRNLTQTLKQLSSEVLTSKGDAVEVSSSSAARPTSLEGTSPKRRQGAIIESMHHHGKGVYSGTFSGTLNPALQDRFGRPKRDISTIIHILNDLLCATPQYRAVSLAQEVPKPPVAATNTGTSECSLADSVENRATRGKMERLRLVLGQRRERRRAMRAQPYSSPTGHDHVTA